ncbi:hypothetical protein V493_00834 [Pseudogymnoascus sp. VKM F-4281 (FW-2241)]|nr:hypothetical protein V493_00834 [Pseudogymnoascus sp. VKM F-4281 (FW-2241)]
MALNRQMLIDAGETITGYTFNIAELLWESEQASGSNAAYLYPEGNKRLAMIGDAVSKLAILGDLRARNIPRGSMDSIVQRVVNNANLERVGRRNHIDDLVNRNPSQQGIVSPRIVADTVEAILGAVYLDSGNDIDCVRLVMARIGLWPQEQEQQLALL